MVNNVTDNIYMQTNRRSYPNSVVIYCKDMIEFEKALLIAVKMKDWHALTNVYIIYKSKLDDMVVVKTFYALWFYKITNAIIMSYDKTLLAFRISIFSPYITNNYTLQHNMGCYTLRKLGMPLRTSVIENIKCEHSCVNVNVTSKLKANNLGTCIGFDYHTVKLGDLQKMFQLNLFEDKSKNLHGCALLTHFTDVPFIELNEYDNGTYQLRGRDGMIWNTMAELMNFTFFFSNKYGKKFSIESSVYQLLAYSNRQLEMYLIPLYIVDLLVVPVEFTFPYKESGVCILAKSADYETVLFDVKILKNNFVVLVQFLFCFIAVWITFIIFNRTDGKKLTIDQIGKDFMNSVRNTLSITPYRLPKKRSFKIFHIVSMFSFFLINFSMQAAITSFFTAIKKGKEVETFEDIIRLGYNIEGMVSPEVVLPETDDIFIKINEKLTPTDSMYICIDRMLNDTRRFCITDCAAAYYFEKNNLNEKGEQYLHVTSDRLHSHYLSFAFPIQSHLTDRFNNIITALVEAGIINKWEDYKYDRIKTEVIAKPLSMNDLIGILECYGYLVGLSCLIFAIEVVFATICWLKVICINNVKKLIRKHRAKKIKSKEDKTIVTVSISTQTF